MNYRRFYGINTIWQHREKELLKILSINPCTTKEMIYLTGWDYKILLSTLKKMLNEDKIIYRNANKKIYYGINKDYYETSINERLIFEKGHYSIYHFNKLFIKKEPELERLICGKCGKELIFSHELQSIVYKGKKINNNKKIVNGWYCPNCDKK